MEKAEKIRRELDAQRLREMRVLMGLTSSQVCKKRKMNNGQYSRIEAGELSADKVLPYVEKLYREWKKEEIRKLEIRIEYIKTLC